MTDGPASGNGHAHRDEVLADRARGGDLRALSLLLARWREPLVRFCRRLARHEEDARDLAHDALLRVTSGLASYDPARPFAPWIYRIAKNACLNHLERERIRSEPPVREPSAPPPPDVLVARREEVERVRAAIRELPPADRELLTMKLVAGLPNATIARRLGIAPGALRTRASRALARLRARLDPKGGRS